MMRRALFPLLAGTLLLPLASAQNPTDFSGVWKMDISRSESAHQDTPIGPVSLKIQQTAGEFVIATRRSEPDSAAITTETLTCKLDGTDFINGEDSEVKIKSKAHWDGPKLVVETAREINGSTVTTHQIFELDSGGKELTVQKTLTVQHGYQGSGPQKASSSGADVYVKAGAE
jgi:hypothetical protein